MKTTVATVRLRPDEADWLKANFGSLPKGLRAAIDKLRAEHKCRIHQYEVVGEYALQGEEFENKQCVNCGHSTSSRKRG